MGWQQVDLLKVDIEGSEIELFGENCEDWINKVTLMFIEVHDLPSREASKTVFRALEKVDCGYYLRPCGENLVVQRLDTRK
jgi:hypothetical protein